MNFKKIKESEIRDQLMKTGSKIHEIDMGTRFEDMGISRKYEVVFVEQVPMFQQILFYFPEHPDRTKRKLLVKKRSDLNRVAREINKRITDSSTNPLKVVVLYDHHMLKLKGLVGRLYLFWASRVTSSIPGTRDQHEGEDIPVLINTDGAYKAELIVLLTPDIIPTKIGAKYFTVHQNAGLTFVCDDDLRETGNARKFQLETRREAEEIVASRKHEVADVIEVVDPFGGDSSESSDFLDDYEDDGNSNDNQKNALSVRKMADGHVVSSELTIYNDTPTAKSDPNPTPRYIAEEVTDTSDEGDVDDLESILL